MEGTLPPESKGGDQVIVGTEWSDDAAVVRLSGDDTRALILTTDTIAPLVDDATRFGRIAAANALSDVYAMGGRPLYALNLVFFPDDKLPLEILKEIMLGAAATCQEAGVPIVGGHTVRNGDVKFGLAVTGELELDGKGETVLSNTRGRAGQHLVLSKALGTGVLGTAIKKGEASDEQANAAMDSMCRLNREALEVGLRHGVTACTDVTGFGLLGHLRNILRGSQLSARLYMNALPLLPGALDLTRRGFIPGGSKANLGYVAGMLRERPEDGSEQAALEMLTADAQTSGGLLMTMAPDAAAQARDELLENGHAAAVVGELTEISTDGPTITLDFSS
jgi:selenide,water dikinase